MARAPFWHRYTLRGASGLECSGPGPAPDRSPLRSPLRILSLPGANGGGRNPLTSEHEADGSGGVLGREASEVEAGSKRLGV